MVNRIQKQFFVFLVFISGIHLYAQKTDSLKRLLPQVSLTEKLEIYSQLIDATLYNNLDSACYYAHQMEQRSEDIRNTHYQALAYRGLGICNFYRANYYQAEDYILKAIELQKKEEDTAGLANSYKILTGIYWETERYKKSVEISFDALALYRAKHDLQGVVSSYSNIGLLYKRLGEPDKAMAYFKKAVFIADSGNLAYNRGNLYNNMGVVYKEMKNYRLALLFYRKALKEFQRADMRGGVATSYLNLGNIYVYHIVNTDSGFYYLRKGIQLSENTDYTIQTSFYISLAGLYARKGMKEENIHLLKKALALAQSKHDLDIQEEVHYALFHSFEKEGNNKEALFHLKKTFLIRDTLSLQKAKVALTNLEAKFENEKNKIVIRKMQEKQQADKKIKTLLILGLVLLFISFLLMVYGFVQSKKKSRLRRALLEFEKGQLEENLHFKSRQLTAQALMMMKKNRLLNEIMHALSHLKEMPDEETQMLSKIKNQLKRGIRSDEDWKLFRHYFEEVNPHFFTSLLELNDTITPSELKLAALVKLRFTIKEAASILNISPNSVKTIRSVLRKKLGIKKEDNIYAFLNTI
jgi:tetratricopeptide (TPR) repeat protein